MNGKFSANCLISASSGGVTKKPKPTTRPRNNKARIKPARALGICHEVILSTDGVRAATIISTKIKIKTISRIINKNQTANKIRMILMIVAVEMSICCFCIVYLDNLVALMQVVLNTF